MTTLLLAAHGTRDPVGALVVADIAAGVLARLPGVRVEVAYADVREPSVAAALDTLDGPTVVVPAFLANGYHVRVDLPAQIAGRATLTPALGPDPALVAAAADRLREAGWHGEPIVLAAAGSTDPRARADIATAATLLANRTGVEVRVGYATGTPTIAEMVRPGWAVASWLLAPGLFHRLARATPATTVAAPLGPHPQVIATTIARYLASPTLPPREPNAPNTRVQRSRHIDARDRLSGMLNSRVGTVGLAGQGRQR
ncbi:sirohydrochlorin chelatase [Actinophytocola sediminis]